MRTPAMPDRAARRSERPDGDRGRARHAAALAARWGRLFRRPLPQTSQAAPSRGDLGSPASGSGRDRRDRWGVPHMTALDQPDLWFGQGFSTPRTGSGRWTSTGGSPAGGSRRSPARRAADRPARAHARAPPRRRARGGGARARAPGACSTPTAPGSTPPRGTPRALPFEFQLLRLGFEPWRPADMLGDRQAARLRALDQLGARAAARRHGARAGAGADGAASTPPTRPGTRS